MGAAVATRQFGHARVSVVDTGHIHWGPRFPEGSDWRTADTPLDDRGLALMGNNWLVVQSSRGTVVVDPSAFPPDQTDAGGDTILEPGPPLEAGLDKLGVDPGDVRLVLVTHGHDDHFNSVLDGDRLRFPNAEHVFPRADWDGIVRGEMYNADEALRLLSPVEAAGKLRLTSGDVDVDDGVSVLHTPGETAGHQVVRFDFGDERLYSLGDLFHFPIEFRQLRWGPRPADAGPERAGEGGGRNPDHLEQSRRQVLEDAAAKPSTLVFTHGIFPAWGVADPSPGNGWIWRYLY